MNELEQYLLDFDSTHAYFQEQLKEGNILSGELLHMVDFSKGEFFTLLPSDLARLEELYSFEQSILPNGPQVAVNVGTKTIPAVKITSLSDELGFFLYQQIQSNSKLVCIFEEMIKLPHEKHTELFHTDGIEYDGQIYYFFNCNNFSPEKLSQAAKEANCIWHFLCVLSEASLTVSKGETIDLEEIIEICRGVKMITVGAYDGEGYLYWRKGE